MASPDLLPASARREIRERTARSRAARPAGSRLADDLARDALALRLIQQLIRERSGTTASSSMACYLSAGTEPGTAGLVDALVAAGHRVLVPKLVPQSGPSRRHGPDWAWYRGRDDLGTGPFGIPEPPGPGLGADALAQAAIVVAAAIRAGSDGSRIGTGGGWYDRALVHARPGTPVLVLLNDDEIEVVPQEPHDRPVDWIVTPTRTIRCRPRSGPPQPAEYH